MPNLFIYLIQMTKQILFPLLRVLCRKILANNLSLNTLMPLGQANFLVPWMKNQSPMCVS